MDDKVVDPDEQAAIREWIREQERLARWYGEHKEKADGQCKNRNK